MPLRILTIVHLSNVSYITDVCNKLFIWRTSIEKSLTKPVYVFD